MLWLVLLVSLVLLTVGVWWAVWWRMPRCAVGGALCACGYDRAGLGPGQACPECGGTALANVRAVSRNGLVWWAVGMPALVLALTTLSLMVVVGDPSLPWSELVFGVLFLGVLVAVAIAPWVVLALVLGRRRSGVRATGGGGPGAAWAVRMPDRRGLALASLGATLGVVATAGVLASMVMTTQDAQAGLALLWIPLFGPLASGLGALLGAVVAWWSLRSAGGAVLRANDGA